MRRQTIRNARLLTLAGAPVPRRGDDAGRLGVIEQGWISIDGDRIAALGPGEPPAGDTDEPLDAGSRVLLPAFVDCHTHACWAGQRLDEFEMALGGATYLEILESGGGIMSTVRAVRAASEHELRDGLLQRLARMAALGTATAEVKSGYGLTTGDEMKMLRAIQAAGAQSPMTVVPTFLGAHAIDRDNPHFIDETINQTLPAVAEAFPGIACDAYCEEGAWSLRDTMRYLERAAELGCPVRVHADQFHSLGMTRQAIELGAVSVDHLEATTPDDLKMLAGSDTVGVALPCSGFHLDDRYAPARALIDQGGILAIASNYNPGSAPTPSIPFTIALACRKLSISPAEAITAATINAAFVLDRHADVGALEPGRRADLQILDSTDERELAHEFATAGPRLVMIGGRVIASRGAASSGQVGREP